MKNLKRVVWTRGMFLTPQHFQTHDNLIDDTLQFRFAASNFANWGVTELQIHQESLANGIFTVNSCRGVLPDGTIFSMPESDPPPPSRVVNNEFFPQNQESLDVYLAFPERQSGGRNFAQSADAATSASTRYLAETIEASDETGYDDVKTVQLARKNFRLLFGTQSLDGFFRVRIAQLERNDAGGYQLAKGFIAPCLDISSSEYLKEILRRQIEILVSKADSLNAARHQRGQTLADFNTSESASFWLLHTVNSSLPELQHIAAVRHGHPEALWVSLLRLAGGLATFSLEPKAREYPKYDHENLGYCFTLLDEKIRKLLNTVLPSKYISIPLRQEGPSLWVGSIANDEYFKNSAFFLALNARMGVDELINKTPLRVLISPSDEIHNLIRLALPGIRLSHTPTPPSGIPMKLNNQYFALSQDGRYWNRVVQSRSISLHIPSEFAEPRPELLVVLP